jgi:hypothetical protein
MKRNVHFKSISDSVSTVNEDCVGVTKSQGWVLDGATSISNRHKEIQGTPETDASWFVRRFSEELKNQTEGSDIVVFAKHVLDKLQIEASAEWDDWNEEDVPSSSFSHIAIEKKLVSFTNLGDCRILYQVDGGPVESFGSCNVTSLDLALLGEYLLVRKNLKNENHFDAWKAIIPTIRKNRKRMNIPGGYWILSPDGEGLNHVERMSVPYENSVQALLVTDGLYRLVDTYFQLGTKEFFAQAFESTGLEVLLSKLRKIETNDPHAIIYPRVKLQDDATALVVDLTTQGNQ